METSNKKKGEGRPVQKTRKSRLAMAMVCLMLVGALFGCGKEENAARIIKALAFEGSVTYTRGGNSEAVYQNMNFETNDRVQTGNDGGLMMQLDSDRYLYMYADTDIEMELSGDEKDNKTRIKLNSGEIVNSLDSALSDNSEYEIQTSNATIGIRGTEFYTKYVNDKTVVYCTKGAVKVETKNNNLEIGVGEGAIVEDDQVQKADIDVIESLMDTSDIDFTGHVLPVILGDELATSDSADRKGTDSDPGDAIGIPIIDGGEGETGELPVGSSYRGHFSHYIYNANDGSAIPNLEEKDGITTVTNTFEGNDVVITETLEGEHYLTSMRSENGEVIYKGIYSYDNDKLISYTLSKMIDGVLQPIAYFQITEYSEGNIPIKAEAFCYLVGPNQTEPVKTVLSLE